MGTQLQYHTYMYQRCFSRPRLTHFPRECRCLVTVDNGAGQVALRLAEPVALGIAAPSPTCDAKFVSMLLITTLAPQREVKRM